MLCDGDEMRLSGPTRLTGVVVFSRRTCTTTIPQTLLHDALGGSIQPTAQDLRDHSGFSHDCDE